MRCPGDQPGQRVLRAERIVSERSCAHATTRRVAPEAPPRRLAHAERPAGCRGEQDRTSACKDADAAGGDRGDLLQAENIGSCAWSQDLSLSAARLDNRSGEPGVGGRWRAASSILLASWTGSRVAFWPGVCRSRSVWISASRGGFAPLWQAGDLQLRSG